MEETGARSRLIAAIVVAAALGLGLLVLQRWVAETRGAAIALVSVWFAAVGIAALLAVRRRPELRAPMLGTYVAIAVASAAVGYWTGFRDTEVDEDVVMATAAASAADRQSALAGEDGGTPSAQERERPPGPIELATGAFAGADGHAASGRATVVREQDGNRILTFTDFDADPGPGVVVYLARDEANVDDVIELGDLKGNVGDQQYEIPADANLSEYGTVILWCVPFTTRIAVAPLR